MDKRKEPIRAGQEWEFPLRIENSFLLKPNIGFSIEVDGDKTREGCPIKLVVFKDSGVGGRSEWRDEHEFDTHLDVEELPFDRLVDVGSLIAFGYGMASIGDIVVDRVIAFMLAERSDSSFAVTDSNTDPGTLKDEERKVIFKLKLGSNYAGEVILPWSYASKYFVTS